MQCFLFFFQAEDGIRDADVTGVRTCALPISSLAIRVDAGGEKIFVIDDQGRVVPGWSLFGAIAELMLRQRRGGKLAVPVTAPNLAEHLAHRHGAEVVRTRATAQALTAAAGREGV